MTTSALDSERTTGDLGGNSGSALPAPCPRLATPDEWEAWHQSLTWEQQLRRGDLDPPEHQHSAAEAAKADARAELRRAQRFEPDTFSYAHDRRTGPWPRVDQLEAPALSNTWRTDPGADYSPGGFALRIRQIPHCELVEERMPRRALRDMEARLAWIVQSIEHDETAQRAALTRVLRERHRRLPEEEGGATRCAMAWSHLVAIRCDLAALSDLAKEARGDQPAAAAAHAVLAERPPLPRRSRSLGPRVRGRRRPWGLGAKGPRSRGPVGLRDPRPMNPKTRRPIGLRGQTRQGRAIEALGESNIANAVASRSFQRHRDAELLGT